MNQEAWTMSMSAQAYDQYQKTTVETITPGKLLIMLYDGAIKDLRIACDAINNKDVTSAHTNIVAAQAIMMELMTTLNMDYKISENLLAMYEYMYNRLVEANVKKEAAILIEVSDLLTEFRQTWDQAIKSLAPSGINKNYRLEGVNISG